MTSERIQTELEGIASIPIEFGYGQMERLLKRADEEGGQAGVLAVTTNPVFFAWVQRHRAFILNPDKGGKVFANLDEPE